MSERGECSGTKSIELVLEEHNLFLLLADNVDHLAHLGCIHELLARIGRGVIVDSRLQVYNLLSLVNFHAKLTSLTLQLVILLLLVLDLLKKLLLLRREGLKSVSGVLLKLLDLALKTLLVLLILLLVLALNDLLGLLGNTVELHIQSSLLVVLNL